MEVLKIVVKAIITALIIFGVAPLVMMFLTKATGNDEIWGTGMVLMSQFFAIFYYNGMANAESEISNGIAEKQLPPLIKPLLFLHAPNRLTIHTILYQAIVVIMTMISLFLIFFIKMDPDVVAGRYIIFGILVVAIATIFWNRSKKYYR